MYERNTGHRKTPITIGVEPARLEALQKLAAARSKDRGWRGSVSYADLIREGIDHVLGLGKDKRQTSLPLATTRKPAKKKTARKAGAR